MKASRAGSCPAGTLACGASAWMMIPSDVRRRERRFGRAPGMEPHVVQPVGFDDPADPFRHDATSHGG